MAAISEQQKVDVTNTEMLTGLADETVSTLRGYFEDQSGWQVAKKNKDASVEFKSSSCEGFTHGRLYRGQCDFKCSTDVIFEYLSPVHNEGALRVKWDKDINSLKTLKLVDQETYILRTCTNSAALGLISPRDFTDLLKILKTDDGFSINARSILSDAFPEEAKFVRGWNHPCGVVCRKHPETPNVCTLTTFVQSDIKGMLPKNLVESALPGAMAGLFTNLKSILQKDKKLVE